MICCCILCALQQSPPPNRKGEGAGMGLRSSSNWLRIRQTTSPQLGNFMVNKSSIGASESLCRNAPSTLCCGIAGIASALQNHTSHWGCDVGQCEPYCPIQVGQIGGWPEGFLENYNSKNVDLPPIELHKNKSIIIVHDAKPSLKITKRMPTKLAWQNEKAQDR